MKIDVFAHILPEKYLTAYGKKNPKVLDNVEARSLAVTDVNMRVKLMDRFPDVLQVLTIANPPLDRYVKPDDAAELARIANDELAELLVKYPKPLYEKMVKYDLPIWIHPITYDKLDQDTGVFSWPFETSMAMYHLVTMGIFNDFPNIKFITHHCGAMIPFFEKRIKWIMSATIRKEPPIRNPEEHFRKFYNDTAVYGNTNALMCGYGFFGADHLLFGTDAPLGPRYGLTGETISSIERMSIPENEKEKIFLQNAVNLLKLPI
jgi:predicted TIM-barrel fold metal-dependent hydrolase